MAGYKGWWIGRIETSGVATAKGGSSPEIQDTVFDWADDAVAPTVATADITGLTAIAGGPYPTQAAAMAAAGQDPATTTGTPGTGTHPGVTTSTVGSSNGTATVPNPLAGLAAIGDFFQRLTQKATWTRIAEVAIGVLLLAFGLNKALGNPAGQVARTAAKGAAFL